MAYRSGEDFRYSTRNKTAQQLLLTALTRLRDAGLSDTLARANLEIAKLEYVLKRRRDRE